MNNKNIKSKHAIRNNIIEINIFIILFGGPTSTNFANFKIIFLPFKV
jgi:hypothetical protein